jgi:hypothetical protein
MPTPSKIFTCQEALAALLTASSFFANIPIVTQRKGDVTAAIATAIQKNGVGVVVMLPGIDPAESESPQLNTILKFAVLVTENVPVNQARDGGGALIGEATGKPAEQIVEKIISLVHWKPNGVTAGDETIADKFVFVSARELEPHPAAQSILNYQINVNTQIDLS